MKSWRDSPPSDELLRQVFGQRFSGRVCDSPANLVASAECSVWPRGRCSVVPRCTLPAFSVLSARRFWGQLSLSCCAVALGLCQALGCTSGSVWGPGNLVDQPSSQTAHTQPPGDWLGVRAQHTPTAWPFQLGSSTQPSLAFPDCMERAQRAPVVLLGTAAWAGRNVPRGGARSCG